LLVFLFIFFVFLLFYSYLVYPLSLLYISAKNQFGTATFARKNVVVLAAWNEEKNIEQTIRAIFNSSIASSIEKVLVGDDNSTDYTFSILENLRIEFPRLIIERYNRMGKPSIINQLVSSHRLNQNIYNLIFIDANISLDTYCIEKLNKVSSYSEIGVVGASILPKNIEINFESEYILRENKIKAEESRALNHTIGVFGACYLMKGEVYRPTPSEFITDDLYHTFIAVAQSKKVLYSQDAIAYEDITLDIQNEFNRKRRYSAGNFQILIYFWKLLLPWKSSVGFLYAYFFHKIIRWISPIVFFSFWTMSFFSLFGVFSLFIAFFGTAIILFLFLNYIFQKSNKTYLFQRFYYFFSMNLAIFYGFFDYLKGIKSNVWERSKRA
jgi:hypothetical protein